MKSLTINSQEIHHHQPPKSNSNIKTIKMLKIQMLEQIMNNDDNNDDESEITPQISSDNNQHHHQQQYQQQQQIQQDQNGLFIKKVSSANG